VETGQEDMRKTPIATSSIPLNTLQLNTSILRFIINEKKKVNRGTMPSKGCTTLIGLKPRAANLSRLANRDNMPTPVRIIQEKGDRLNKRFRCRPLNRNIKTITRTGAM
jgi:hypothetical protein